MDRNPKNGPPLLRAKAYDQPSLFTPENLLREARRQKSIGEGAVPAVCVLDPNMECSLPITDDVRQRSVGIKEGDDLEIVHSTQVIPHVSVDQ